MATGLVTCTLVASPGGLQLCALQRAGEAKVSTAQHLEVQRVPTSKPGHHAWGWGRGPCGGGAGPMGLHSPCTPYRLRQRVLRGGQASSAIHLGSGCPQGDSWAPCPPLAELLTTHWAFPPRSQGPCIATQRHWRAVCARPRAPLPVSPESLGGRAPVRGCRGACVPGCPNYYTLQSKP